MEGFVNAIKRAAGSMDGSFGRTRCATITSYDPVNHAVKVSVQPEGVQSGWLPLGTVGVGDASIICGPKVGDQVIVEPQEGVGEQMIVVSRIFDTIGMPPVSIATSKPVQSGEVAMFQGQSVIHMSGGNVFINTGTIEMTGSLVVTGNITTTGTLTVNGNIESTATITALEDMNTAGISFRNHVHSGVQTGPGDTGPPVP